MALKLSNNASGILALAISDSATSLTLRAGQGSRFPVLGSGDWFPITVVRASDPSQLEIMRCTARSGDTLTVVRAQEGTAAIAFDAGDVVSLRLTAGTLEENFVRRSDLGTAATRDVTTSPTDTTAGRVLTVGSLGLGGAAADVPGNNIDDNTIPTGFYYVISETSGTKPPGDNGYGHLIVSREGSGATARQLYLDNDTDRIWTRVWTPLQWSTWKEVYHTGNIAQVIGEIKGKRMLFLEATAPPGWTQDTSINDRVLRIVNSAGGGLGGSWTISGLSASVSVGATTLSVSQIPSHSHTISHNYYNSSHFTGSFGLSPDGSYWQFSTGATGGGGSHTHSASASISSNGTWRPAYVDVIACRKD